MADLTNFQLLAAALHFLPALIWALVAHHSWRFVRTRCPKSHFFRMLPVVGTAVAINYLQFTLLCLLPRDLLLRNLTLSTSIYAGNDCAIFTVVALARHMSFFFPTPERAPSAAWLFANYASSLLMCGFALTSMGALPLLSAEQYFGAYLYLRIAYQAGMLATILVRVLRLSRPSGWRLGGGVWQPRRADALFLGGGILSLLSWLVVIGIGGWERRGPVWQPTPANLVLDTIAGIGFAAPLATRILGEVLRGVLLVALTIAAIAGVSHAVGAMHAWPALAGLQSLLNVATIAALLLVIVPGHGWVREFIDRAVFGRRRRRREELQNFLHAMSPELGVTECCRRAMGELRRVMQLRGVAILLNDGELLSEGVITTDRVQRDWPRNDRAAAPPMRALVGYELRELPAPLQTIVSDSGIGAVVVISGRHRLWGYLFLCTNLLAATFSDEEVETLEVFADQLALILDNVQLLGRVVAAERSLAHREKLAAIGELAARVAHEIRNPVTAARSLAQQLAEEPMSPLNTEHAGLILSELERVERQVAALLRFARREEFQFGPVDLTELARTTVDALRPRLDAAGIRAEVVADESVVARADREKLRQVLINLIENARDALVDANGSKSLSLAVGRRNGSAALDVIDTGPGVPPDALPRLFEPFFSLKPQGTGLGLAIAKRTIEAHGGAIDAVSVNGMTFRVELPLAEPAA